MYSQSQKTENYVLKSCGQLDKDTFFFIIHQSLRLYPSACLKDTHVTLQGHAHHHLPSYLAMSSSASSFLALDTTHLKQPAKQQVRRHTSNTPSVGRQWAWPLDSPVQRAAVEGLGDVVLPHGLRSFVGHLKVTPGDQHAYVQVIGTSPAPF